ncbi:MAG: hypothetical protein AABO57_28525, partial [Acidobacteriota bacterium]
IPNITNKLMGGDLYGCHARRPLGHTQITCAFLLHAGSREESPEKEGLVAVDTPSQVECL